MVVAGNVLVCSTCSRFIRHEIFSHTFVSTQFFRKMNKEHEPLDYELVMSQPTNKGMICLIVYRDYSVCIDDTVISTNLIPLEI